MNTKLFRYDLSQISLMSLGYGAEVEIQASGFEGFSLVQMPLRGAAEFISDGVSLTAVPGDIAILTPKQSVHTLWNTGCKQLILKVPHSLIPTMETHESTLPLSPAYKINTQVSQQWQALLQHLLTLPPLGEKSSLNPNWLLHFEKNIALFLLSHQPEAEEGINSKQTIDGRRLNRVEEYIHSAISTKISLADLAAAAEISVRTLNLLCHRQLGLSPMMWLRNIRLDAALW